MDDGDVRYDGGHSENTRESIYITDREDSSYSISLKRFDDEMNYHELMKLEAIFRETNGGKGLDVKQFRNAMKMTLGYDIDDNELDVIFMKVDTNSDGTVDWDEYLSYMLLEYQEKENMMAIYGTTPFPNPMTRKSSNHLESICSISLQHHYSVRYNGRIELDDDACRYITLSKDGTLNVWNTDWTLQKSTMLDGIRGNPRSVWFTDLVCMPNCNIVAAATTDYEISFYSTTSNMFQKKFQIRDMDCCALNLVYHFLFSEGKRSILLWGDTSGSIIVMRFYDNPSLALFSSSFVSDKSISFSSLLKTTIHNLKVARFQKLIPDWVKELHFYANDKNQEFFVACCRSPDRSMIFAEITEKVIEYSEREMEMRRISYFNLRNGVTCVAYDPDWNLVASGSSDYHIRIWNPYVATAPTTSLKGHVMPVQQIYIRKIDHHVISISKDKNIRVWNLVDYTCKQSIHGRHVQLGRLDITTMFYNETSMELVVGSNIIGVFVGNSANLTQANRKRSDPITHINPITKVLYNNLFKMLVTCSEGSMICVWDVRNGAKTMQFTTERDIELSAMAFDPSKRRLITGSRDGKISMWNFNNGALLHNFKTVDMTEVSDIIHAKNRIVSAGWNNNVTIHQDSYSDGSFKRMKQSHNSDILSMDYHLSENIMATSSCDGKIIIWSLDMECIICQLDMHRSMFPIYEKSRKKYPDSSTEKGASSLQDNSDWKHFIFLPADLPWLTQRCQEQPPQKDMTTGNRAVNKILFLQSRRTSNSVAVIVCATMGYVASWSVQQAGGLLAYFIAVNSPSDTVVEMESDQENEILITGDNQGYLKVWDIRDYCSGNDVEARRHKLLENQQNGRLGNNRLPSHSYVPIDSPPQLMTSFRGHCKAITSIAYIPKRNVIASGSADCSVRLWTVSGRYIGTFGQSSHWSITTPVNEHTLPPAIPVDVRRVASPCTLYTIKGGYHQYWKHVRHAVDFIGRFRRIAKCFQIDETPKEEKDIMRRLSQVSTDLVENAKAEGGVRTRRGSVTVWMEDMPHSINKTVKKEDMVDVMWKEIQDNGITSKVLGKINYKPRRRHKTPTIDTKINWMSKCPIIYSTLPCAELVEPVKPTIPEYFQNKIASQNSSFSRYGNKVIERKKVLNTFNPRKHQSGQNFRRNSKKYSSLSTEIE